MQGKAGLWSGDGDDAVAMRMLCDDIGSEQPRAAAALFFHRSCRAAGRSVDHKRNLHTHTHTHISTHTHTHTHTQWEQTGEWRGGSLARSAAVDLSQGAGESRSAGRWFVLNSQGLEELHAEDHHKMALA